MKKKGDCIKLFLNNKAQTMVYHMIIQVIIAVAIYLILQSYIDSVAKDTLFEKSYLSKDIALMINTIYASPGELSYTYANDKAELNKFEFNFGDQKVRIKEAKSDKKLDVEYPYGEDLKTPFSAQRISNSNKLVFSKTKNTLEVK